ASVRAGVESGGQAGEVAGFVHLGAGVRDLVGPAGFERADELGGRTRDDAHGRVLFEAGTRVGDVEVAHGHLADAVLGAEGSIADALHRQLLRVVGQVRSGGVDDRVVVAATQTQGDLAGDRRGDPALHGFAQHQRLRVEPASLVHAPTQAAALLVVEGDRVL